MLNSNKILDILIKHISEVEIGEVLANLGEVLEIEQTSTQYTLVISRLNEKQVLKFDKQTSLIIISSKDAVNIDTEEVLIKRGE